MAHPHSACIDQARNVYFVYHPRRPASDVSRLVPQCKRVLPATSVPTQLAGDAKVLRMPGDAFRALALSPDPSRGFALLEPLLFRADLVKLVLEKDEDHMCVWAPKTCCGASPEAFEFHDVASKVEDHFTDMKQYLSEVADALNRPTGRRSHQRFFSTLDRKTNSALLKEAHPEAKEEIETFVGHVTSVLRTNLPRRVSAAGNLPLLNGMRSELDKLAAHFMDILAGEYSTDSTGEQSWERAIELFATGQLRIRLQPSLAWVCQPDSAYYFLLGEFALSACQLLRDGQMTDGRWTTDFALRFANVAIRTQPLYAQVYGKRAATLSKANRGPDAYRHYDFDETGANAAFGLLEQTRGGWRNLSFEDLCTRSAQHVSQYLPGWLAPQDS